MVATVRFPFIVLNILFIPSIRWKRRPNVENVDGSTVNFQIKREKSATCKTVAAVLAKLKIEKSIEKRFGNAKKTAISTKYKKQMTPPLHFN